MAHSKNVDLRRDILDQARSLLLSGGYPELSMRKIAGAIGCTPTSIYLYFQSKDALLHALVDEGMELLLARLQEAADSPGTARQRLGALCRAYTEFALANPEYYEVMFALRIPRIDRYPAENYRRARRNLEVFASVLADADRDGEARIPEPFLAASVIWSALHGALGLCLADRVDRSLDRAGFLSLATRHAHLSLDAFDSDPGDVDTNPDNSPEESHQ